MHWRRRRPCGVIAPPIIGNLQEPLTGAGVADAILSLRGSWGVNMVNADCKMRKSLQACWWSGLGFSINFELRVRTREMHGWSWIIWWPLSRLCYLSRWKFNGTDGVGEYRRNRVEVIIAWFTEEDCGGAVGRVVNLKEISFMCVIIWLWNTVEINYSGLAVHVCKSNVITINSFSIFLQILLEERIWWF